MGGTRAAKRHRRSKSRSEDEILYDRELEDLPPELRWREWMMRIEAVIFASTEPVSRETLARVVGKECSIDLIIDDLREELSSRPYELVSVAGGWQHRTGRGSPRRSGLLWSRQGEGLRPCPSSRRWC